MDKDITRLAVERAAQIVMQVKKKLRETIPYGPSKVRLTPAELRKRIQAAPQDVRQAIMQRLDTETFLRVMGVEDAETKRPDIRP